MGSSLGAVSEVWFTQVVGCGRAGDFVVSIPYLEEFAIFVTFAEAESVVLASLTESVTLR